MKKFILLIALIVSYSVAVKITIKDGTIYNGDVIFENKGSVVIKEYNSSSTVSIYKKSIQKVNDKDIAGARKFMFGDSLILKNKNDLLYINSSNDTISIKIREYPSKEIFITDTIPPHDSIKVAVPDGSYYETVKYYNKDKVYYTKGRVVTIETKPKKFKVIKVDLKGYGDNYPNLKGPKMEYEK